VLTAWPPSGAHRRPALRRPAPVGPLGERHISSASFWFYRRARRSGYFAISLLLPLTGRRARFR